MRRYCVAFAWLVLVLAGCGGAGSSVPATPPDSQGYWKGFLKAVDVPRIPTDTVLPAVGDFQENRFTDLQAIDSNYAAELKFGERFITGNLNGWLFLPQGTMLVRANMTVSAGSMNVVVQWRDHVIAKGHFTREPYPALGVTVAVPPAGKYHGEIIGVSGHGYEFAYGDVSATVDASGRLKAYASCTSWVVDGDYVGTLEPDGTLSDAVFGNPYGVITQTTPPRYSYVDSKLVVRYDHLGLAPVSAWLTLRPD